MIEAERPEAVEAYPEQVLAALPPAVLVAAVFGAAGIMKLLILGQVVLGLQLPVAVVPLLWASAVALIALNLWVLRECL